MQKNSVTEKLFEFDRNIANKYSLEYLGGVDEVGRGPLCGPVVVACCIMPLDGNFIEGVNDSKKVSEKKREELYDKIISSAIAYSIIEADNNLIDEINILEATKKCMNESIDTLSDKMSLCLIDAVNLNTKVNTLSIIKGDATSYNIACASIIAKVYRDRLMREYDKLYPEYGFASNKGYGTKEHIEAIKKSGITPIHRKSFVKNFLK